MGSGRDKRKKAKGSATAGKGSEKTARKSEKNAEKAGRRAERAAEGGEDDIDALLAQFKMADEATEAVSVAEDRRPSPRVYGTLTVLPAGALASAKRATGRAREPAGKGGKGKGGGGKAPPSLDEGPLASAAAAASSPTELLLYGGEWVDAKTDNTFTYGDMFVLESKSNTWTQVTVPGCPPPRSSHQAVSTRGFLYVFGGEFTSRNGDKFRHYADMWRLDYTTWRWEQLPSRNGPSARSGHRCVLAPGGGRILLFGGFYDAGRETRYYGDLWSYDLEELRWDRLGPSPNASPWPSSRGGCQLALHGGAVYVVGGFSVVPRPKDPTGAAGSKSGQKRPKSGRGADDDDDDGKAVVHDDVWRYDVADGTWERIKKAGMAPNPRTSFGLITHRDRAVLFGGVLDREGARDKVYSELFNELYSFDLVKRRWFPMALRRKKTPGKKEAVGDGEPDARGTIAEGAETGPPSGEAGLTASGPTALELALHRAATKIQAHYRGFAVRKAYRTYRVGGVVSELLYSPATVGVDWTASDHVRPRARAAPLMAVLKNTLYLLGGVVEIAHSDVVLDDLWSLDLAKLDGWECLAENTLGEDAFKDDEEWESESEEDE